MAARERHRSARAYGRLLLLLPLIGVVAVAPTFSGAKGHG
jgi:hypothetical protein